MSELIYYGDAELFRKLKDLYHDNNSKKTKKKTCLENISFMFKENHFQFPPRSINNSNYHGSKSKFGTNVLFEKLKVFKNVIGVLTWNGDEYFPSQTLTLFDLNRSNSIVHVLELTEDEMIYEKVIDFQLGDDFVVCQTESTQLYFIGLYSNKGGINYHCDRIPSDKIGKTELIKCGLNKILIKSMNDKFYIGEVKKLDQTPHFKPIEAVVSYVNGNVKGVHFGETFTSALTDTNNVFSDGRFIITGCRYGSDWIYHAPANLQLPTTVTNIESIFGDNHSFMVKDANPNANRKYYMHDQYWLNQNPSLEDWILKLFPEEHSITIEQVIPNGARVGYLVLVSFGDSDMKRLVIVYPKGEFCKFREHLTPLEERNDYFHTYDFPSYFYSVTGFHQELSFDNCHFTNDFILFEMNQAQKSNFHTKLSKNTQYLDLEIVTQNEGVPLF